MAIKSLVVLKKNMKIKYLKKKLKATLKLKKRIYFKLKTNLFEIIDKQSRWRYKDQIFKDLKTINTSLLKGGCVISRIEIKNVATQPIGETFKKEAIIFDKNSVPAPTIDECLQFKDVHTISDLKWISFQRDLHCPIKSLYKIRKYKKDLNKDIIIIDFQKPNKYCFVDYKTKLTIQLTSYVELQHGSENFGTDMEVCFSADGTLLGEFYIHPFSGHVKYGAVCVP